MPNESHAACPSQHATPVAIVPRVQVVPSSVEYARKILFVPGSFDVATMLLGLVGLTFMKLSAWLPDVALTLTTASRQVSGLNSSNGFRARSGGFMHLRVPSGTSMPPIICPCKMKVAGARNAKRAARIVRRRRVFMWYFIDEVVTTD